MKILIILPTWLGDAVMASAALRAILSHFATIADTKNAVKFTLYGSKVSCELFAGLERLNLSEILGENSGIFADKNLNSLKSNDENLGVFKKSNSLKSSVNLENSNSLKSQVNLENFAYFDDENSSFSKNLSSLNSKNSSSLKSENSTSKAAKFSFEFVVENKKSRFKDALKYRKIWGKFDYGFSFRGAFSARILLFLLGAKRKFIFDKSQNKNAHQVLKYLYFIENALGISGLKQILFLPKSKFTALSQNEQRNLCDKMGLCADKKWLGINPGAKYGSAKCWKPEYFAAVALKFSATHEIIIFGTSSEAEICAKIEALLQENGVKVRNLCGKTSLNELCALISRLDIFVSNDSGAMHIAAFYQTPTIAIFGPTRFTQTSPWQSKNAKILHLNLPCQPCMKRECPLKHHACMADLKPEFVIDESQKLLKNMSQKIL